MSRHHRYAQPGRAELSPEYPGERLVACRNEALAKVRAHKRLKLLAATDVQLTEIGQRVKDGKLTGQDNIGLRVGRVINKYKMAKHFALDITDTQFDWSRRQEQIDAEAALDGLYTSGTCARPGAV